MTIDNERLPRILQDALQGLIDCAVVMHENAVFVEQELPNVRMSVANLAQTRAVCRSLAAALGDVHRTISELESRTIATAADRAVLMETACRGLSRIHESLFRMNDLVSALNAEADDAGLPALASTLVTESAVNILRAYEKTKAACDEMQAAIHAWPTEDTSTADPRPTSPPADALPAVGQAVTVLQVGAEGGDVTLVGRRRPYGAWQFALASLDSLEWVENWDEALQLMDRHPWARLHPLQLHPAFVERVRLAVDARLTRAPTNRFTRYSRERWESLFRRTEGSSNGVIH